MSRENVKEPICRKRTESGKFKRKKKKNSFSAITASVFSFQLDSGFQQALGAYLGCHLVTFRAREQRAEQRDAPESL